MIKDFMWTFFEQTGDINAYLGFKDCNQNAKNTEPSNYDVYNNQKII